MGRESIYEKIHKFHAHLDVCSQCEHHPFDLCPIGARLLKEAATADVVGGNKVDKIKGKVMVLNTVRGDWPIGHNTIAEPGVYDAYVNPHGAVSVKTESGQLLGLKPSEFEWISKD